MFGIRTLDLVGADESTELRVEPEQELYKGLWSGHFDRLAFSLQFEEPF